MNTTSVPSANWGGDPSSKRDFLTFVQMTVIPLGHFAYRVFDGEHASVTNIEFAWAVHCDLAQTASDTDVQVVARAERPARVGRVVSLLAPNPCESNCVE